MLTNLFIITIVYEIVSITYMTVTYKKRWFTQKELDTIESLPDGVLELVFVICATFGVAVAALSFVSVLVGDPFATRYGIACAVMAGMAIPFGINRFIDGGKIGIFTVLYQTVMMVLFIYATATK